MDSEKWQQCKKDLLSCTCTIVELFHVITSTLLSLLLPLSFLLLGRLSMLNYLFTFNPSSISSFFYTNSILIYTLISLISITTLISNLTGKTTILPKPNEPVNGPSLYLSWFSLCTLQVCVGLGIEGSIAAKISYGSKNFDHDINILSRCIFFLGLYETMIHWSRTVVKPVVDDTVFGYLKEEIWAEKVAMGASFGALWCWRLKGEVGVLVVMPVVKEEIGMNIGLGDFVGWWLYYLTLTIGMVRIVKGIVCVGVVLLCRRTQESTSIPAGEGKV